MQAVEPFWSNGILSSIRTLLLNGGLAWNAKLGNIGVGACVNATISLGVAASAGVCQVADPNGNEAIAITLAATSPALTNGPFSSADVGKPSGVDFEVDAGTQLLWSINGDGSYKPLDLAQSTDDSLAWCWNGSVGDGLAGLGQLCWSPRMDTPFDLKSPNMGGAGDYSTYAGVGVGEGISVSTSLTYTYYVSCFDWYQVTGHDCPPAYRGLQPPPISGSPSVGSTLTAGNGDWSNANNVTYTYQWTRCTTSDGSNCAGIANATGNQYVPTAADKGSYLSVTVTASNSGGSVPEKSATVGPVP